MTGGTLFAELRYKPWGETRYTSGTTPTSVRFTGQHEESGLGGLYFYDARWYDPAVSRFLSADTLVPGKEPSGGNMAPTIGYDQQSALTPLTVDFHEPVLLAGLSTEIRFALQHGYWFQLSDEERREAKVPWGPENPQALNRYSYTLSNPLRYTDPTGHCIWDACVLEFLAVSALAVGALSVYSIFYADPNAQANRAAFGASFETAASGIVTSIQEQVTRRTMPVMLAGMAAFSLMQAQVRKTSSGETVRVRKLSDAEVKRLGLEAEKAGAGYRPTDDIYVDVETGDLYVGGDKGELNPIWP